MSKSIDNIDRDIVFSCKKEKYFKGEIILKHHSLVRIVSGEMKVIQADGTFIFKAGDTLLFPRNQLINVIKYPKEEIPYKSVVLYLSED